MVRYELGNGKTILITLAEYLDMTDEQFQKKISEDAGVFIIDPFSNFDSRERMDPFENVNGNTSIPNLPDIIPNEELDDIKKKTEN